MHVPRRFAERVSLHLALNVLDPPNVTVPLLLGIHGRPGEGKTAMTRQVLREMGVVPMAVFADSFENVEAGEPAKELRRRYLQASEVNASVAKGENAGCRLAALVIDDLDQRIAGNPDIALQQTQNTPLLNAALMELADSPRLIDGVGVARTPIIVTVNHLDWLYAPLSRSGRMAAFRWEPRLEEKVEIVKSLFPEFPPGDLSRLIGSYPDSPISDFGAARHAVLETVVGNALRDVQLDRVLPAVRDPEWVARLRAIPPTLDVVLDALDRLARERTVA
jgi:SpoVK/Ycf46/Vps4 family AAA+-type ATPase